MKKLIAAVLMVTVSIPALAWGDREQGIVAGIIGTLVIQNAMRDPRYIPPPVYPGPVVINPQVIITPQPYYAPRPPVCHFVTEPRADMYGNIYYAPRRYCF